ncbi:hypothetical protein CRUP_023647 [Coryphaenoides rupestris]|nr:hypothetical protein CRUP_023647 [Coryphaenoides rupestris]
MAELEITADILDTVLLDVAAAAADAATAPGRSGTARAVALARLLHQECTALLQLYRGTTMTPGVDERVGLVHAALRQCLGLLHCLILREEEEEMGEEGEYEAMRRTVRRRLEHLLHSTRLLLPEGSGAEEVDGDAGSFALKMWTYRVLLELLHWADHASTTLHIVHTQSQATEEA